MGTEETGEVIGDPVCWLARVCPDCGRLAEDRYADLCSVCGGDLPDQE
ncbi:MAG: hypothetical protein ABJC62_04795 [Frankiaceae bacterium]|jgi:hypothetical protein